MDWDLKVRFSEELGGSSVFGETAASPAFLEAAIGIKPTLTDNDVEITLVHELLHVRFPNHSASFSSMFERSALIGQEFEVGIEMTARALVAAYREDE